MSRTLLHDDYITFAVQLAYIRLKGGMNELDDAEYPKTTILHNIYRYLYFIFQLFLTIKRYDFLLTGGDNLAARTETFNKLAALLTPSQQRFLSDLQNLPSFLKLADNILTLLLNQKIKNKTIFDYN